MALQHVRSDIYFATPDDKMRAGPQGAVSIVRLSGPEAVQIAQQVFQPSGSRKDHIWQPRSHRVYHGLLQDSQRHAIDEVPTLAGPLSNSVCTCAEEMHKRVDCSL